MDPSNATPEKTAHRTGSPVNGAHRVVDRRIALGAFGGVIGTIIGAEIALMIGSPVLGIGAGGALGTACGALVGMRRMSPGMAALPFVMACMLVISFNGTINSVIGPVAFGALVAAITSVLPRPMSFSVYGALLGIAIVAIPCTSYGRPVCEYLRGQRQIDFIVIMAIAGLGIWFLLRRHSKTEAREIGPTVDSTDGEDFDEAT
jgi:hypothetical protein